MTNYTNGSDMPIGFGMALAKDLKALNHFSVQSPEKQKQLIEQAKTITSKDEMESFVNSFISADKYF